MDALMGWTMGFYWKHGDLMQQWGFNGNDPWFILANLVQTNGIDNHQILDTYWFDGILGSIMLGPLS